MNKKWLYNAMNIQTAEVHRLTGQRLITQASIAQVKVLLVPDR